MMGSMTRSTCLPALLAAVLPVFAADWNPRLAASYLDSRQQAWAEWPKAKAKGGTCVSCHTGAIYLMARPALARVLGEKERTRYEAGLLDSLRARLDLVEATPGRGVESIFAALFLSLESGGPTLSPDARKAFDRLWALQI